nr:hypothetical protein [Tanacetum cinerariifolium]
MELYTKLQQRVLDLETTKTTQDLEIDRLKRRVKNLARRKRSRTHGLKRLYKVRTIDIDANEDIYLVNVHKDEDMFGVNNSDGDEVIVKDAKMTAITTTATIDDITLDKALKEIKNAKPKTITASTRPKAKGLVIHEQKQAPRQQFLHNNHHKSRTREKENG